jgi:2-C-methyl-D-erythritol 4-phosphate cytidylyltransferase
VPALPLDDTVKRVDGDRIVETVDREGLVAAQTPQAFVWSTLHDAAAGGNDATDCASLVEARGGRIKVVPGDTRLLKVTEPADLETVALWLAPVD